ncbi:MAG: nuclear transport factor 2 family protein [Actinomycetota bacterium]|nr:nuclear transport factor 2 family protein [Actinomycetota bacterium]
MHESNAQLLKDLYSAFDNADLATIQSSLAEDSVIHFAGAGPLAGTYKGKDEVLGLLAEFISRSEGTYKIKIHDVLASDDHVVVLSESTAKRADKELFEQGVEVFHVKDGQIAEAFFTGMNLEGMHDFFS